MPVPTGNRLDNSFAIWISFSLDTTIGLWEKSLKPFGIDSGGVIDTTTGRNVTYRTKIGKKLKDLTPCTGKAAYDEGHFSRFVYMIGKNQQITLTYPNGRPITFWGVLTMFEPDDMSNTNEDQPTASFTVTPTNQNDSGAEVAPTVGTTSTTTATTTTTP